MIKCFFYIQYRIFIKCGTDVLANGYYIFSMPTVSVKLGADEYQTLLAEAERRGASQSAVLREGLRNISKAHAQDSLADRMRDLIGSANGPEDLSLNEEYLGQYGSDHS